MGDESQVDVRDDRREGREPGDAGSAFHRLVGRVALNAPLSDATLTLFDSIASAGRSPCDRRRLPAKRASCPFYHGTPAPSTPESGRAVLMKPSPIRHKISAIDSYLVAAN